MKVIGVDVGIRTCGYTICEVIRGSVRLIQEGEIKPSPKLSLPQKLNCIFEKLGKEVMEHQARVVIVEKLYSHHRHPTTLGILAQVRGVVVLLAHRLQLDFAEFTPTRARKSFLGKGSGKSKQVKRMAENITGRKFMSVHTADAFSLVVAFAGEQRLQRLTAAQA